MGWQRVKHMGDGEIHMMGVYTIWAFCNHCGDEFCALVQQRIDVETDNKKFCPSCGKQLNYEQPGSIKFDYSHPSSEKTIKIDHELMNCAVCDHSLLFAGRDRIRHIHLDFQKGETVTGFIVPLCCSCIEGLPVDEIAQSVSAWQNQRNIAGYRFSFEEVQNALKALLEEINNPE